MEKKRQSLETATADSKIAVVRTRDNQLQLTVSSDFSFDTGSAAIKPSMAPILEQLVDDLERPSMATMKILIVGHTDSTGPDDANEALSVARAQAVRKVFEAKGVPSTRITVEGRGEKQPLVDSNQDYARALNRRIEIYLRDTEK